MSYVNQDDPNAALIYASPSADGMEVNSQAVDPSSAYTGANANDSRMLFCCDNPETLNQSNLPDGHGVLWHYEKTEGSETTMSFRVYTWHHNQTGNNLRIGIVVQNSSAATITVALKGEAFETGTQPQNTAFWPYTNKYFVGVGQALNQALLGEHCGDANNHFNNYAVYDYPNNQIPGQATAILHARQVINETDPYLPHAQAIYCVMFEFTLTSSEALRFSLRTAACQDGTGWEGNLRQVSNLLPVDSPTVYWGHPRGTWPHASLVWSNQDNPFDVADQTRKRLVPISRGLRLPLDYQDPTLSEWEAASDAGREPDFIYVRADSNDAGNARRNWGNYGSYYSSIKVWAKNTTSKAAMVVAALYTYRYDTNYQDPWLAYSGAIHLVQPTASGIIKLPVLRGGPFEDKSKENYFLVTPDRGVNVPTGGSPVLVAEFQLAHAGGTSLPVGVYISKAYTPGGNVPR